MLTLVALLGGIFLLLGLGAVFLTFVPEHKFKEDIVDSEEKMTWGDYLFLIHPGHFLEWLFGKVLSHIFDKYPFWVVRVFFSLLALILFFISFMFFSY